MAQPTEVRAFRKRLKAAGYSDIEILRLGELDSAGDRLYLVRAREPLSGLDVSVRLCASDMGRAFQRRDGTLTSAYPYNVAPEIPISAAEALGAYRGGGIRRDTNIRVSR